METTQKVIIVDAESPQLAMVMVAGECKGADVRELVMERRPGVEDRYRATIVREIETKKVRHLSERERREIEHRILRDERAKLMERVSSINRRLHELEGAVP